MKRLVAVIVLFALYACKKDKTRKEIVSGIVIHSITKEPLINQKVSVWITTYKIGPKDPPEFPNGKPIFTSVQYVVLTDNAGRFTSSFEVEGEWIFSAELVTGEYIQRTPLKNLGFIFPGDPQILNFVKATYDTLLGEKPGFVKYHIKNVNDNYINDTLLASTYYKNKWLGFNYLVTFPEYAEYNWVLPGAAVNIEILDTIPSESNPLLPVKWLHKRTDTILLKNETIPVFPMTTTDYYINY
jgi:hypothetical protein